GELRHARPDPPERDLPDQRTADLPRAPPLLRRPPGQRRHSTRRGLFGRAPAGPIDRAALRGAGRGGGRPRHAAAGALRRGLGAFALHRFRPRPAPSRRPDASRLRHRTPPGEKRAFPFHAARLRDGDLPGPRRRDARALPAHRLRERGGGGAVSWLLCTTFAVLVAVGIFHVLQRDAIRLVLGFSLLLGAANLFVLLCSSFFGTRAPYVESGPAGGDPVPQVLILTAIAIGFGVTALLVPLVLASGQPQRAVDVDECSGHRRGMSSPLPVLPPPLGFGGAASVLALGRRPWRLRLVVALSQLALVAAILLILQRTQEGTI